MRSVALLCTLLLSPLTCCSQLWADVGTDLAGLVPADVVAIAYVDLTELRDSARLGHLEAIAESPLIPAENVQPLAHMVQELSEAGIVRVYALLRVADIEHKSPIWIVVGKETHVATVRQTVQAQLDQLASHGQPMQLRSKETALVVGVNHAQLDQFDAALAQGRFDPQRIQLGASSEQAALGVLAMGDQDSRRVLRETFPRLPAPFAAIDGNLIADDVAWCHLALYTRGTPRIEWLLKTRDSLTAQRVGDAVAAGANLAQQQLARVMPPEMLPADFLQPVVTEDRVQILLGGTAAERSLLINLVGGQLMAARGAGQRSQRLNQVRQLVLAMLNFESVHGTLVQPANYDADGRPLLSWRVHLLPYLNEEPLYREFHLDEPWDSPHNRKLIERMPVEVFADPDPHAQAAVGVGHTTWVLPVGKATAFPRHEDLPNGEPLKFRDLKDGTSQTIAIVQTLPERAVIWTKPDDWSVDLAQPLDGVISPDRQEFIGARCDGSAAYFSASELNAESWRALLTRAAGDLP